MSRRGRLIGLAIALVLLANGVVNYAVAGIGVCKPAKSLPVCKPVKVCEPVKEVPVCRPSKPLPPPEVCKPVKVCEPADTHGKHAVSRDHLNRLAWRLKRHAVDYTVVEDAPQPTTSAIPPAPAPVPKSPTT
jgi:hypothetical protein